VGGLKKFNKSLEKLIKSSLIFTTTREDRVEEVDTSQFQGLLMWMSFTLSTVA